MSVAQAQAAIAMETRIPFIALCPIGIDPAKQPFVFAVPQPVDLMIEAVAENMKARGVKTVAWLPHGARGHAVLVALACEEIVLAPEATFGAANAADPAVDADLEKSWSRADTWIKSSRF